MARLFRETFVVYILADSSFSSISDLLCNRRGEAEICFRLRNKRPDVQNFIPTPLAFVRKGIRNLKCCASLAEHVVRKRVDSGRDAPLNHYRQAGEVKSGSSQQRFTNSLLLTFGISLQYLIVEDFQ